MKLKKRQGIQIDWELYRELERKVESFLNSLERKGYFLSEGDKETMKTKLLHFALVRLCKGNGYLCAGDFKHVLSDINKEKEAVSFFLEFLDMEKASFQEVRDSFIAHF